MQLCKHSGRYAWSNFLVLIALGPSVLPRRLFMFLPLCLLSLTCPSVVNFLIFHTSQPPHVRFPSWSISSCLVRLRRSYFEGALGLTHWAQVSPSVGFVSIYRAVLSDTKVTPHISYLWGLLAVIEAARSTARILTLASRPAFGAHC